MTNILTVALIVNNELHLKLKYRDRHSDKLEIFGIISDSHKLKYYSVNLTWSIYAFSLFIIIFCIVNYKINKRK
jgi:hypothetical protein